MPHGFVRDMGKAEASAQFSNENQAAPTIEKSLNMPFDGNSIIPHGKAELFLGNWPKVVLLSWGQAQD